MIPQSKSGKYLFLASLSLLVGVALFLILAGVDRATGMTSHAGFCGRCHSMKLMTETYYEGVHSSVAVCTDCHLPQDGFIKHYLYKAKHGLRDVVTEHLTGAETKDWLKNLSNASEYVYKSGCLKCHDINDVSSVKIDSHEHIFADEKLHCITCHRVGHKGLRERLADTK